MLVSAALSPSELVPSFSMVYVAAGVGVVVAAAIIVDVVSEFEDAVLRLRNIPLFFLWNFVVGAVAVAVCAVDDVGVVDVVGCVGEAAIGSVAIGVVDGATFVGAVTCVVDVGVVGGADEALFFPFFFL